MLITIRRSSVTGSPIRPRELMVGVDDATRLIDFIKEYVIPFGSTADGSTKAWVLRDQAKPLAVLAREGSDEPSLLVSNDTLFHLAGGLEEIDMWLEGHAEEPGALYRRMIQERDAASPLGRKLDAAIADTLAAAAVFLLTQNRSQSGESAFQPPDNSWRLEGPEAALLYDFQRIASHLYQSRYTDFRTKSLCQALLVHLTTQRSKMEWPALLSSVAVRGQTLYDSLVYSSRRNKSLFPPALLLSIALGLAKTGVSEE